MTSRPGKQLIAIQILSNISIFGQLTEYNMINIFLEKNIHKMWSRNYSQTLFLKIKIKPISGSIVYCFIQFAIFVCQVEGY